MELIPRSIGRSGTRFFFLCYPRQAYVLTATAPSRDRHLYHHIIFQALPRTTYVYEYLLWTPCHRGKNRVPDLGCTLSTLGSVPSNVFKVHKTAVNTFDRTDPKVDRVKPKVRSGTRFFFPCVLSSVYG